MKGGTWCYSWQRWSSPAAKSWWEAGISDATYYSSKSCYGSVYMIWWKLLSCVSLHQMNMLAADSEIQAYISGLRDKDPQVRWEDQTVERNERSRGMAT